MSTDARICFAWITLLLVAAVLVNVLAVLAKLSA